MATDEMSNLCLICGLPAQIPSDEIDPSKEHKSGESTFFPGCEGSLILNEKLRMYFTISKLLKFSERQCIKLLKSVSSHVQLCFCCGGVVNEAVNYHLKVLELKSKIAELGTALRSKRKEREGNGSSHCDEDDLGNKIRRLLRPVSEGDCNPDTQIVKVETDVNATDLQSLIPDELQTFFGDDGNHWSDTEFCLQNEAEAYPFKRKSVAAGVSSRKQPKKNFSDSDSDYEPSKDQNRILNRSQVRRKSGSHRRITAKVAYRRFLKGSNYHCEQCNSKYATIAGFKRHLIAHRESKRLGNKFDCPQCGHPNLSDDKLRRHTVKVHQKVKNTCQICGHFGHSRRNHEKHMLKKHGIDIWASISEPTKNEEIGSCAPATVKVEFSENVSLSRKDTYMLTLEHQKKEPQLENSEEKRSYDTGDKQHIVDFQLQGENSSALTGRRHKKPVILETDTSEDEANDNDKTDDCDWAPPSSADGNNDTEEASHSYTQDNGSDSDFEPESQRQSTKASYDFHTCEICSATYKTLRGYQKHQSEHLASAEMNHKYDCKVCGYPCTSDRRLRYHKKNVHQEITKYPCKICSYQALKPSVLQLHMRNKHNPNFKNRNVGRPKKYLENIRDDGKFVCLICKTCYSTPEGFARHMDEHKRSEAMNGEFDCSTCHFPCLNESRLLRHNNLKHGKSLPTCQICNRRFRRPNLLRTHMNLHNEYDKTFNPISGKYSCQYCDTSFPTARGLRAHHLGKHKEQLEASLSSLCSQCGKRFSSEVTLRRHIRRIHEKLLKFSCQVCGKEFEDKTSFNSHQQTHGEIKFKRFVCEICGVGYSHNKTLQMEMDLCFKEHTAKIHPNPLKPAEHNEFEKPGKHPCKHCKAVFPSRYVLKHHIKTHKELYNFPCNECGKSYISRSSLRLHSEISHSAGRNQFPCEFCGKVFLHKHYVICHYKYCNDKKQFIN